MKSVNKKKRDYIEKQIEQLSQFLHKILTELTGFQNSGQTLTGVETIATALKIKFELNIQKSLKNDEDFWPYFIVFQ